MKNMTGNAGFSVIELLVAFVIVAVVVIGIGFIGGVCRGNYWVGEESALESIQRLDPTITHILLLERHIWGYTRVVAAREAGGQYEFAIDTNILQNRRAMAVDN